MIHNGLCVIRIAGTVILLGYLIAGTVILLDCWNCNLTWFCIFIYSFSHLVIIVPSHFYTKGDNGVFPPKCLHSKIHFSTFPGESFLKFNFVCWMNKNISSFIIDWRIYYLHHILLTFFQDEILCCGYPVGTQRLIWY